MNIPDLHKEFHRRIAVLRQKENLISLRAGFLKFVAASLVIITAAGWTEILAEPDTAGRWLILLSSVLAVLVSFAFWVVHPLLQWAGLAYSYDDITLAHRIGKRFPEIKDRLANALEIYEERDSPAQSEALIRASLEVLQRATEHLDFSLAADKERLGTAFKRSGMIILATAAVILIFFKPLTGAMVRLMNPGIEVTEPQPFDWIVSPGDIEILHGQNVSIQIFLKPNGSQATAIPDRISLWTRQAGVETFKEEILKKDSAGIFRMNMSNLRQDVFYYASAIDRSSPRRRLLRSNEFHITALKRPSVKRLQVEIDYPDYSGLETKALDDNTGDIGALKGSRVKIRIESTKALTEARLVFSDSTEHDMTLSKFSSDKAEASFVLTRNGSYHLQLKDTENIESSNSVEYRLSALSDEYPLIKLLVPDKDLDVDENMAVPLQADLQDDFGLTRLLLHYRIEQPKSVIARPEGSSVIDLSYLIDPSHSGQSVSYTWSYASIGLQPEEVMSFYLEVFDNDAVSGPKSSKSDVRKLRFPSLEEILSEINKEQDQQIAKAEDIAKESEQIRKELDEINKELLKENKKLDWKEKEQIKQLTEKQQKMQKDIEAMKESLDKMTEKMNDHNLLSKETMEKYQELQKLLSEVNSKELQDVMEKLQQAMKNNFDQKQMKDALRNFKFDQDSFKKNIDRTVELLKRIKAEQMFDQLKKQADELKRRQDQVNELSGKIKNENERNALTKEQEHIKKSLEQLEQRSEELRNLVNDIDKKLRTDELDKAIGQIKSGRMQKRMDQSQSSIRQGTQNSQEDKDNQKEISRELDSLARRMEVARKEFQQQQNQQIMDAMRKIVLDMLEISKDQERIMEDSKSLTFASSKYRESAQRQSDVLSNMSRVTENLIELSNKTFFVTTELGKLVASALGSMNDAVKELEERNTARAVGNQNSSMIAVNDAIKFLLRSMDKMNSGQSGTGLEQLMAELEKMAGQQQGINDQTGPMSGRNPGQLTPEEQAQLGRMMAEQQALRESLENMQSGLEGHQDIKGRLDQMAKEMDEVIKDMQKKNINRETVQRQQKILQRMLDATKSKQEKDLSEKRKGETGKDYKTRSPNELPKDLTDRKNKLRQELLREMKQGYSKDYEDLIRKYFEALGHLETDKQ